MNETESDRRIREVVMDWLVTSEDEVSGPMRYHAKKYIETAEAEVAKLLLQNEALQNTLDTIRFGMQKQLGVEYLKKATEGKTAGDIREVGAWVWYCANHMLQAIKNGEAVVRSVTEKRNDVAARDQEDYCQDHGTLKPCRHCLGNKGL